MKSEKNINVVNQFFINWVLLNLIKGFPSARRVDMFPNISLAKIISINQKWIVYNYIQRNENEWLASTEKRESLKVMQFYSYMKIYKNKYYLA